jgi:hypothetical protein
VKADGEYRERYPSESDTIAAGGTLTARLEPRSAKVWIAGPGRRGS